MNAFNRQLIEQDPWTESCDQCGAFIVNWNWMGNSFVTFDGRVVCKQCRPPEKKNLTTEPTCAIGIT